MCVGGGGRRSVEVSNVSLIQGVGGKQGAEKACWGGDQDVSGRRCAGVCWWMGGGLRGRRGGMQKQRSKKVMRARGWDMGWVGGVGWGCR